MVCWLRLAIVLVCVAWCAGSNVQADDRETPPQVLATDLVNPESVCIGPGGRVFVSVIGEFDRDGDGAVLVVDEGTAKPFATKLNDPKGLAADKKYLYVADKTRVLRISARGKVEVLAAAKDFPRRPMFLNDVAIDDKGAVYVSDSGDLQGSGGAIFRIAPKGGVTLITDASKAPTLKAPNGLWVEEDGKLLVLDLVSGDVSRVNMDDGSLIRIAASYPGGDGLVRDSRGKFYISEWSTGRVFVVGKESRSPALLSNQFKAAADCCLDAGERNLLVPDMTQGQLVSLPLEGRAEVELDESPFEGAAIEPAFANLSIRRPIFLTHAGDGSGRVFIGSQYGQILVLSGESDGSEPKTFLDIEEQVDYSDDENEQGLLGLAVHPNFKDNGEVFVYYSLREPQHTTVVSRFHVSSDDPDRLDPASEEILLSIQHPYWNHKGGTLAFGPDQMLHIVVGDGGFRNDPQGNGQNLRTLLGKILRIDVDRRDQGKGYAVPQDNPFLDYPHARPEIWAFGLRNVWRMTFDRKTGVCWAGDVGQDIWEEVDLIVRGGNYGWNMREGRHPFGAGGLIEPREDVIEPIFEYHHDVGKSITGGHVYRGERVPALSGAYLYADYVSGQVYGLWYDEERHVVVANRPIPGNIHPVMSFGEDEQGEVYYMTTQGTLQRFAPAGE